MIELKDIVAISGIPGLHKIVGRRSSGLIVESIDAERKRIPTNLTQKVSILEDIAIYTQEGEARLGDVLLSIWEKEETGLSIPDKKADDQSLRKFLKEVLPNYDESRVYVSDIKKLVGWYQHIKNDLDWMALKNKDNGESSEEREKSDDKGEVKKVAAKKPVKTVEKKVNAPKAANIKSQTKTPRKTGGA